MTHAFSRTYTMQRHSRKYIVALALVLTASPAVAQSGPREPAFTRRTILGQEQSTTIDTTIPFAKSGGVVDLSVMSGEIKVTGWARAEAHIHVSSEDVPVRFETGPDRILLDTYYARHRHGDDGEVRYELSIPTGTRVIMHSNSGDLQSRGTKGEVEARSISGDLEVEDVARSATLESISGNVRSRGIDGDARLRSVSGDVDLENVHGDLTLSSVSGHVQVTDARSRVVRMETVSGDLEYSGTFDPTGTYDFHAHSGDVRLELPSDVGAILSIETFSGDVRTDFPLTIQPTGESRGPSRHQIDTTLGKGGAHVTVSTFSGDVELRRSSGRTHSE
jgi:hypothetical protein